jgi:hypothetical protein
MYVTIGTSHGDEQSLLLNVSFPSNEHVHSGIEATLSEMMLDLTTSFAKFEHM